MCIVMERIYPYLRLLPLAEKELWPPGTRDDVIKRRVKEVEDYLKKVPFLTFKLTNVPAKVRIYVEYEKESAEEPSLLYDYVLGKHKAISIRMKDLIPLPDLIGVRILFNVPKKYKVDELFGSIRVPILTPEECVFPIHHGFWSGIYPVTLYPPIMPAIQFTVSLPVPLDFQCLLDIPSLIQGSENEDRDNDEGFYELGGLVEFNDRHVYFIKPDFLTYKMEKQKSPRLIPFRMGFIRLSLIVEHADGTIDKIKLGEAEVFWIRHSEMCSGVAWIVKKKIKSEKKASEMYSKCVECFKSEAIRSRDNWALLLIHRVYRDAESGKWKKEWIYKMYNFINTNAYKLPDRIQFGNQVFEIVDFRKYKALIEEDMGVHYNWELEPYSHTFTSWFVKTRAKKKGEGDLILKPFRVHKLKPLRDDEEWYLLVPEREIVRIVVENRHHWHEGWGRIFVELRRGAKRTDALLIRHRKLYPQIIIFDR